MTTIKGTGIVLNSVQYTDNNTLVSIYLFEHGLQLVSARGINSKTSKLKIACMPMSFGEYVLSQSKSSNLTMKEFDPLENFYTANCNYKKYLANNVFVELMYKYFSIEQKQDEIALLGIKAITSISFAQKGENTLLVFYLIKMMKSLGFLVDENFYAKTNFDVSSKARAQIKYFKNCTEKDLDAIDEEKVLTKQLLQFLNQYLYDNLDISLKSVIAINNSTN